jgi:hypothetical protein
MIFDYSKYQTYSLMESLTCNSCKCLWKPIDTDKRKNGIPFKNCQDCRKKDREKRERLKCIHNKRASVCEICSGASLCVHRRRKIECKECLGSAVCLHNRIKYSCMECIGTSICKHHIRRSRCRICQGGSVCIHNQITYECKECNFKNWLLRNQRDSLRRLFKLTPEQRKCMKSIDYLGCSIEFFVNHIQKQFVEGMTWNNIHLDHIRPVSSFNLEEEKEFLLCANWKNFQPLFAKDNLEKSNKFTKEDEEKWIELFNTLSIQEKTHQSDPPPPP